MPKKKTWEDFPRTKDKLAIVGFAGTRKLAPWDSDEYEIMALNEEYVFPWFKRADRWLQIHPAWDFTKDNNQNDPNHYYWLQNKSGPCIKCEGRGYIVKGEKQEKCNAEGCDNGTYHPLANRGKMPIYMQDTYPTIPNSVKYPLELIHEKFFKSFHPELYFTSSAAYMLGLGMLYGYKQIDFYGFEMGTSSEYHYQRANFEYLVGRAHGLGFDVRLPKQSPILKGELYGYENMQQGYRQNLEMRTVFLKQRHEKAQGEMFKLAGAVETLKALSEKDPEDESLKAVLTKALAEYHNALALVNINAGAEAESENLMKMYDGYFKGGTESTVEDDSWASEFVSMEYTHE